MKSLSLLLVIFFSFLLVSCGDEITDPASTIENKINRNGPFKDVYIYNPDTGNLFYSTEERTGDFIKLIGAYAENGFLVVVKEKNNSRSKVYFNLSLVKYYEVYPKVWLNLYY